MSSGEKSSKVNPNLLNLVFHLILLQKTFKIIQDKVVAEKSDQVYYTEYMMFKHSK